jgi:hypothetical protein
MDMGVSLFCFYCRCAERFRCRHADIRAELRMVTSPRIKFCVGLRQNSLFSVARDDGAMRGTLFPRTVPWAG